MKGHDITPVTAPQVTPVLYLDMSYTAGHPAGMPEESAAAYPSIVVRQVTESGPDGNPIYRIEGPIPQLIGWVLHGHCNGDADEALSTVACAKLAM
jgi:hypothetical protein